MIDFVDEFPEIIGDRKDQEWIRDRLKITTHSNSDLMSNAIIKSLSLKHCTYDLVAYKVFKL